MDPNQLEQPAAAPPAHRGRSVLAGFLLVGGFFLWTEHRAHLLGVLPYLLVLACLLMHIFHHHGHRPHPANDEVPDPMKAGRSSEEKTS
jgi:hypothetical protein